MSAITETVEPIELVSGKLYRLGGTAPLDGRLSWVPAQRQGPDTEAVEPLNCYLLLEDDSSLLVETGVTLHRDLIIQQLRSLLGDREDLEVFLTRFEPDCVSNLPALTTEFKVSQVHGGGVSNPFDFFDDLSTDEQLRSDAGVELHRKLPGESVRINDSRELALVVTTIRLLTTFWAYDTGTKTLFTSDAFGHCPVPEAGGRPVVDSSNDTATFEQVRTHLFTKFDWLLGAETAPLIADLEGIFSAHDVEIIAPTHGSVLQGKDVVTRHMDMVLKALGEVSA